jgi:GntR family transcriptional regulator
MIIDGRVPKHEQLRNILTQRLDSEYHPGDLLPSERQLCEDYGVSRITVREALGQLVADGRLVRIRGKGTFVSERTARSELHLASFHEDMRQLGRIPTTVVLVAELKAPPPGTVAALDMRAADKAYHVKRLRLADSAPISIDDAWYPERHAPGLHRHDLSQSIYRLLRDHYERPVQRAQQTIAAVSADAEKATLLGVDQGSPILAFDRISYSEDVPVEHCRSWYRSDRYQVQMTVTEPAGAGG